MGEDMDPVLLQAIMAHKQHKNEKGYMKEKKLTPEQAEAKRRRIWVNIAKKEIPKVCFAPKTFSFLYKVLKYFAG